MLANGLGVRQHDSAAADWFRKAAEVEYPPGETSYATMLANGRGVRKDAVSAVMWLRKAAEKNDPSAQFNLSIMYKEGRVIGADPATMRAEAVKWLKMAAGQGHEDAKKILVEMGETP